MEGGCSELVSPLPKPVFEEDAGFSPRKKTPFRGCRPAKSCPPVSRVFRSPTWSSVPKLVSFKPKKSNAGILSTIMRFFLVSFFSTKVCVCVRPI